MNRIFLRVAVCVVLFAVSTWTDLHAQQFDDGQLEFFESKVRPLLVQHCYECHGPEVDEPEGGLSLASRMSILAGGDSGPAIDLEEPNNSLLIDAVQYGDLVQMPPDSKLPEAEIETLRKWVAMKAPWPAEAEHAVVAVEAFDLQKRRAEHWCWQPMVRPTIPDIKNTSWPLDPLDHFILQQLDAHSIEPAEPADRRTWIRRVYFDLIGLPPTPQQIHDFIDDRSPQAYETVVDELLKSEHFGERWARHWMDLIRYAETCGHEFDYPIPHAYQYRDYLIRAFNANVPYDDFIVEQIAGDLMAYPRLHPDTLINESILGTGFWFLGEATHGPVDVKGDEAGRIDNQIDVMSKTFLGLTVACARCHDHKFDAISTDDYYALSGFLQSSRRQDVMLDPHRKILKSFKEAVNASKSVIDPVEEVLSELGERAHFANAADYMRSAVLMLQADRNWLLPEQLVLEGEALKQTGKTSGNARRQDLKGWSGGGQLWWTDANVDDELQVEFDAPSAGRYEVSIDFTKAPDYGIVQVFVNDQVVGEPFDLYAERVERTGPQTLGAFDLNAGTQKLRFRITGKNEKAVPKYMVGVDTIVLKGKPPAAQSSETFESIRARFQLDAERLRRWVAAITDPATQDVGHAFYLLRKSAAADIDLESDAGDEFYASLFAELNDLESANRQWMDESNIFAATKEDFSQWRSEGFAFLASYAEPFGQLNVSSADPIGSWYNDTPHSGRLGGNFQGVLRSPTFEITHPQIQYYISARKAQIRLIVDGFRLDVYNPLLFSGMKTDVDTDGKWQWVTQAGDLRNYLGHRAFIELIDQGDGFFGVGEVRFSNRPPPKQRPAAVSAHVCQVGKNKQRWQAARQGGSSPLQAVTKSLAEALGNYHWYSARDAEVYDRSLFNFLMRHKLIPGVEYQAVKAAAASASEAINGINQEVPDPVMAIGMVDGSPENEFVFIRGNHKNLGPEVPRRPIEALLKADQWDLTGHRGSGRMQLAQHIASPDNPLTARVMVNRLWHHLTGRGIVASVDNFGVLGQQPSHPELLDYLASEFVDDGWNIKRMIRRIVLSQTYRMSSAPNPDAQEIDPANEWLHRSRVRRLQGEAIRDAVLFVSGELDTKMFGPGVPIHLTAFMQGRGRPGKSGPLDGDRRRSIYIEVRRNFLHPMMLAFDTPIPFNSIGRRNVSNVPAQALILMNDPFVVDQAKKWAGRIVNSGEDIDQRINDMFIRCIGRPPTRQELQDARAFLTTQAEEYGVDSSQIPPSQQLWSDLCHVLFNMKEFVYLR